MLFEVLKFKEITIKGKLFFWVKTHELLASSQPTIGGNVSKLLTTFSNPIIWWNIMFSYFCKKKEKKTNKICC
jgi:hypothetical protein